jgi:hypothetical protein
MATHCFVHEVGKDLFRFLCSSTTAPGRLMSPLVELKGLRWSVRKERKKENKRTDISSWSVAPIVDFTVRYCML